MDGQMPQAKLPQKVHSLKEKKVGKENKHPQKERREIYFELRSFNIYFYNPQNHPDGFLKRNGSEISGGAKRGGSFLG